jgi:predicted Zn-dependent protease
MSADTTSTLLAFGLALAVGCTPAEERAEQAREAVGQSIARGDRQAALDAIGDLRAVTQDTADAQLELAQLLVRAGNAPEAGWLLEDLVRRHPGRADVTLALVRVSLLLGNPARAFELANDITSETEQHADALVLRAQAQLGLGDLDQALVTLAEAERLYPERPEAPLVRIATLLSEDRQDEARTAIEATRAALAADEEQTLALRRRLDPERQHCGPRRWYLRHGGFLHA